MLARRVFHAIARPVRASSRALERWFRSEDFRINLGYVGGLVLIAGGVAVWSVPAGLVVAGVASSASALVYASRASREGP